jgi:endonuclease-3
MKDSDIHSLLTILRETYKSFQIPIVTLWAITKKSPYLVLISCILSLRTKDETTKKASERLFSKALTPYEMIKLSKDEIEKIIYPVGFYRVKANNILNISNLLIQEYDGKVPNTIEDLLKLKGVGRKTANLVMTLGFNKPAICVDVHVHRISNRLGYVETKTPEQTEFALRDKLPKEYWIEINDLLVAYGQNVCKPQSPRCSICSIEKYCDKVNVIKTR